MADKKNPDFVLVADDDASVRQSLQKILTRAGFQVYVAADGGEACNLIKKHRLDVAIVDLNMPGKDGLKVLEESRRLAPQLKTIILTGFGERDSYAKALGLGAFDYLNKPIRKDEILSVINKALGDSS